ncbi:MAG TPA: hypothetical protein VG097_07845 [Gemmata sp.]|nr:hypothetical protein [Gemmata sp.]
MAGSGTVLAVARNKGHRAFGVDLDPLAVLLAGVWTRTVDAELVCDKAEEVLDRAKKAFRSLPLSRAYPHGSDDETRKFIRFWFDGYARRQLTALSSAISRVHDDASREVLWCGFSRLIITKTAGASLAMDLSHSRPHREFTTAPIKPFNRFISAVDTVVSNCPQTGSGSVGPATNVKRGDARSLDIEDSSIDYVLTSPPYLNAIDYMRCSKFSLVWMGYNVSEIRQIRSESVGTETLSEQALETEWVMSLIKQLKLKPALSARNLALLAKYICDMGQALSEVSRVLRVGGKAVYVVGDNTVRGTFIRNSSIVIAIAEKHGLTFHSRQSRTLPANRRYMPPPKGDGSTATMDARMRREVVLVFDKRVA